MSHSGLSCRKAAVKPAAAFASSPRNTSSDRKPDCIAPRAQEVESCRQSMTEFQADSRVLLYVSINPNSARFFFESPEATMRWLSRKYSFSFLSRRPGLA